jgi:hypothetical protein
MARTAALIGLSLALIGLLGWHIQRSRIPWGLGGDSEGGKDKKSKPNILFVLTDDLGWGNVDFTADLYPLHELKLYGGQFAYEIN